MIKAQGLDHIHLAVQNLKQSADFFSQFLGAKASKIYESAEAGFRFQFVKAGPVVIQLIEPTTPDSAIAHFIEHWGEGIHALSFKVANLEIAIEQLESQGLKLLGKSDSGYIKQAHFNPKGTFSLMIEICEYPGKPGSIMALFKKNA
ncbi:MAG: methylmalonyl-CoA epimerase [Dehalococcoidia bacterium]|nr:methylmalonyl-CoA epimerase [Dehalococcoidia bacterium]